MLCLCYVMCQTLTQCFKIIGLLITYVLDQSHMALYLIRLSLIMIFITDAYIWLLLAIL